MKQSTSHVNSAKISKKNSSQAVKDIYPLNGHGTVLTYDVLSGVEVTYFDIQAKVLMPTNRPDGNFLEINHCQEGRFECKMEDGCFQYVGEGDMFMSYMDNRSNCIEFPLGYYKGINISINLDELAEQLPKYIPDISIEIYSLVKRFFIHDDCFLIQAKEGIWQLFGGMYSIPVEARTSYYRIKLWEMLVYLNYFDVAEEEQKNVYARRYVDVIKQIEKKITEDLQQRLTITELASMYCISPTMLKATFKGVFGVPIFTYIKEYRIRKSASLLLESSASIMDIAMSVGYRSQSKFSSNFKEKYKLSPLEYRLKHQGTKF